MYYLRKVILRIRLQYIICMSKNLIVLFGINRRFRRFQSRFGGHVGDYLGRKWRKRRLTVSSTSSMPFNGIVGNFGCSDCDVAVRYC